MISTFRVRNYKALRDVSLQLTPIHVLIGPNDSGKTSFLEALFAVCRSVDVPLSKAFRGKWSGRELVWRQNEQDAVGFRVEGEADSVLVRYELEVQFRPGKDRQAFTHAERIVIGQAEPIEEERQTPVTRVCEQRSHGFVDMQQPAVLAKKSVYDLLSGAQFYRWNPRLLCLPNAPDAARGYRMDSSGFGLALCLQDILGYDRKLFEKLESRFISIFPEVEIIRLKPETAFAAPTDDSAEVPVLRKQDGQGIYFQLRGNGRGENGGEISASQASDGMLLVLAYLTVLHLPQPPRVLLIEEPENGIHPARLEEVLKILRDLIESQDHTQVVMTTHSPYVLDYFKPEEVTLCFKDEDGAARTQRLSESKRVREQLDVFTLGEIWAGEGDKRLLEPVSVPGDANE
jgi:predicted ATPase